MTGPCVLLLCLVAAVSSHYDGYPFVHKNDGKYGAGYEYANYGGDRHRALPAAAAAAPAPVYSALPAYAAAYPYGYGVAANGYNNELNYRSVGEYAVNLGAGQFYYLGHFNGNCANGYNYGFYYAGNADSFVVCDHGRSHHFQCPAGTKHRAQSNFRPNKAYGMDELCGVNTLH